MCDVESLDLGPVTFYWRRNDGEWRPDNKQLVTRTRSLPQRKSPSEEEEESSGGGAAARGPQQQRQQEAQLHLQAHRYTLYRRKKTEEEGQEGPGAGKGQHDTGEAREPLRSGWTPACPLSHPVEHEEEEEGAGGPRKNPQDKNLP
ncbi:hypothetical protein CRUP_016561, partial [Coryphaenoides rupestris]